MSIELQRLITGEELVGQTIYGAYVRAWSLVLAFGDGRFFSCCPTIGYEDESELRFDADDGPSTRDLLSAGVLDAEEGAIRDEEMALTNKDRIRTRDLSELHRLMKKYPEWTK